MKNIYLIICLTIAALTVKAQTIQYSYDNMGRLLQEINPDSTIVNYTYDPAGNRLAMRTTVFSCLNQPAPVITANGPIAFCQGDSVMLTSSAGLDYKWSSGVKSQSIMVKSPGTYSVITTIPGLFTCPKISLINVVVNPLPSASVIANTAICIGTSIAIGATAVPGSNYSWASSISGFSSTNSNPSVSPGSTATYTLTETNSNGCTKSNSVNITVNPLPVASVIANTAICNGISIAIGATAVPGSNYSWASSVSGFGSTISNPSVSPGSTATYTLTETNSNGCIKSNSVNITVNPLPVASVIANTAICNGTSIAIGATAVTGSNYSWASSISGFGSTISNPSVSPGSTATYTLTETNSNGCIKSNSVNITVNPLPVASVIANTAICNGTSIAIGATAVTGSNYSWASSISGFSSTNSNPSVSPDSTATYTLTETNSNGCVKSNSVNITVNPLPTASVIANTAICYGSTISIGALPVLGSSYSWVSSVSGYSSIGANPTVSPSSSTSYTLTETNSNGCVKSNSVTITVNPLPAASVIANTAVCIGTTLSIGSTPVSGGRYSWASSTSGFGSTISNPSVTPNSTASYTLTETNSNGCVKSNSVSITVNPLPAASVISNESICFGSTIFIGASPISGSSYSWISSISGFSSSISNPSVSPNSTAAYTLTETNSYSCMKSNSVLITVNPLPAASVIPNTAICNGNTISLGTSSVSGSSYAWTNSVSGFVSFASNPIVSPSSTSTYTLTETNSNNCVKSNSVTIIVNPLPSASVISNTAICYGSFISIGSQPVSGSSYSWTSSVSGFSSTSSNPSVSPVSTTTYTLTETNPNGCSKSNTVTILVNPLPAALVISNTSICNGTSISIGGLPVSGSKYSWASSASGFSSTLANPSVSPVSTTSYTLTETNSDGCSKSNTVTIAVNTLPAASVIPNTSICSGIAISIGAPAVSGSNYSWTSSPPGFGSTLPNPTVSPTSTISYTLTETNSNGCMKTNSVSITVIGSPNASVIHDTSICFGDSVAIGASPIAGSSYSWSGSQSGFSSTISNPSVSPASTATYTLTETNSNSCMKSNSVKITINPLPTASVGANTTICFGMSTTIGASYVTGSIYSWSGSPSNLSSNAPSVNVSPTSTNSYTLTETIPATGCHNSNSLIITVNPLPEANVYPSDNGRSASFDICSGSIYELGAKAVPGNSYSWSSSPSGYSSTSASGSVSPTVPTIYTLTETIAVTGCSKSNSLSLSINAVPAANAGFSSATCKGETISIGAKPDNGITYLWSSRPQGFSSVSSNPSVDPSTTTKYIVTETANSTGCSASDSIQVTVNPLPKPAVASAQTICFGDSANIGYPAVIGDSYSWSSNPVGFSSTSPNPDINPVTTTIYELTETINSTGCSASDSVRVTVNPLPVASWTINKVSQNHIYFHLNDSSLSSSSYSWNFGDGSSSITGYSVNHIFNNNKTYDVKLIVTNTYGCKNEMDSNINVTFSGFSSVVNLDQYGLNIFPNPFTNKTLITFNLPKSSNVKINIIDIKGNVLFILADNVFNSGLNEVEISAEKAGLVPGTYFVNININGQFISRKIVEVR